MMNRLALIGALSLVTACSSASKSRPGAEDASVHSTSPDVSPAKDLGPDAPLDAPRSDGSAFDADTADAPSGDGRSDVGAFDAGTVDTLSGEDRPVDSAADTSSGDAQSRDSAADRGLADGSSRDVVALGCEQAPHDPVLGTANLKSAYRVVDHAVLPVISWLPVALIDETLGDGSVGQVAYGYAGDGRVHRLAFRPANHDRFAD